MFLKRVHLVKQRTKIQELINNNRVLLNGKATKPGKKVCVGDRLKLFLPRRELLIDIVDLPRHNLAHKAGCDYYKILADMKISPSSIWD